MEYQCIKWGFRIRRTAATSSFTQRTAIAKSGCAERENGKKKKKRAMEKGRGCGLKAARQENGKRNIWPRD